MTEFAIAIGLYVAATDNQSTGGGCHGRFGFPRSRPDQGVRVVQGVGFMLFVYALAREFALSGEVCNDPARVIAEVEGSVGGVAASGVRAGTDAPPLAVVESVEREELPARGGTAFVIRDSTAGAGARSSRRMLPPATIA